MNNREIGGNIVAVGFWTFWYLLKTLFVIALVGALIIGILAMLLSPPPPTKVELMERQQTHNEVMCATGFPEYQKYCQ